MKVKKLSGKVQDAQQIPTLFDNENITYHPIDIVNWKEYPYQPQVSFRIAYTNDAILVHYKVVEDSVRAICCDGLARSYSGCDARLLGDGSSGQYLYADRYYSADCFVCEEWHLDCGICP